MGGGWSEQLLWCFRFLESCLSFYNFVNSRADQSIFWIFIFSGFIFLGIFWRQGTVAFQKKEGWLTNRKKVNMRLLSNMKTREADGEIEGEQNHGKWHNAGKLAKWDFNCGLCHAQTCALPWARLQGIDISIKVFIEYGAAHDVHTVQLLWILWEENIVYVVPNNCGMITQRRRIVKQKKASKSRTVNMKNINSVLFIFSCNLL